jgi:hypothetical protein
VCLHVRERSGAAVVAATNACTTASGNVWQQLTSRYTAQTTGDSIDVYVSQANAVTGNSFTVDDASLVLSVPANTAAPAISGTTTVGSTFTATTGAWSGAPTSYAYQWQDCASTGCAAIAGATSSSYVATSADLDHTLRVIVTAANGGGSATAASAESDALTSGVFSTSVAAGATLAAPYTWTFDPGVVSCTGYFWADGTLVAKIARTTCSSDPYTFVLQPGALADGTHTLGHAWDTADGVHHVAPSAYGVTVQNPVADAPTAVSPTWDTATSYAPAAFTPARTIDVYSASAFATAWNDLQPGDEIDVHGVTFSGEQVFSKQLPDWAEVHFDAATKFLGPSSGNFPAAWVKACSHIRFYGGDLTSKTGSGILVYDSSYVTWWGFDIHDTANTGLFVQGINRVNDHLDLKGEISHWGLDPSLDPHAEKGTGLHGAQLSDANYGIRDSRIALYAHDGAAGAGVQAGGSKSTDVFQDNTLYLKCANLTMQATSQVAGNCLQLWGQNVTGNDVKYLEADNLQGRPYDANGLYSGQSLATDTLDYGRATDTNLSPYLAQVESGLAAGVLWDPRGGSVFSDVTPTP